MVWGGGGVDCRGSDGRPTGASLLQSMDRRPFRAENNQKDLSEFIFFQWLQTFKISLFWLQLKRQFCYPISMQSNVFSTIIEKMIFAMVFSMKVNMTSPVPKFELWIEWYGAQLLWVKYKKILSSFSSSTFGFEIVITKHWDPAVFKQKKSIFKLKSTTNKLLSVFNVFFQEFFVRRIIKFGSNHINVWSLMQWGRGREIINPKQMPTLSLLWTRKPAATFRGRGSAGHDFLRGEGG